MDSRADVEDEAGSALPATASTQPQPVGKAPEVVVSLLRRIESSAGVDGAVGPLQSVAAAVVRSERVGDGLRGTWLGHALHPLLTDFPLGAWMSASFLDLFGGRDTRKASRRLIGFGLLVALPTAASGLAEWQSVDGTAAKRVGVVHAGVNTTATVLYGSSWLARRRGEHRRAVLLGVVGGLVATLGGYFGGHLSLVRKVGTADSAFGPGT
ncbi:MAG: DUF2231 domain-containing protein [Actinomycetes bacterium]